MSDERFRLAKSDDQGRFARFRNSAIDEPVYGVYIGPAEGSVKGYACQFDDESISVFGTAEVPRKSHFDPDFL